MELFDRLYWSYAICFFLGMLVSLSISEKLGWLGIIGCGLLFIILIHVLPKFIENLEEKK